MTKYSCKTIIFSSSATIYGLESQKPLVEESLINPINPYGSTKATIEKILLEIHEAFPNQWRIANLRYFNPIGAHPSGLIGEFPNGIPNNIFPFITQVAAGLLDNLFVFGSDWPTYDGTGIRDYIHVMDIAEGHIAALDYLKRIDSELININLGTGIGTSVLELIKTFELVNKVKVPYKFTKRREGDLATLIADNSFAISKLNWFPKRNLREMCLDGWKWQCNNSFSKK